MAKLLFPLPDVLHLADHALAAERHRESFLENLQQRTPRPALWFAGDQGIYMMSNGLPAEPDPQVSGRNQVVYADGYDTQESKNGLDHEIGGDDFNEVLYLDAVMPSGRSLYTVLTEAVAAGSTHLVIDITADTLDIAITEPDSPKQTR